MCRRCEVIKEEDDKAQQRLEALLLLLLLFRNNGYDVVVDHRQHPAQRQNEKVDIRPSSETAGTDDDKTDAAMMTAWGSLVFSLITGDGDTINLYYQVQGGRLVGLKPGRYRLCLQIKVYKKLHYIYIICHFPMSYLPR